MSVNRDTSRKQSESGARHADAGAAVAEIDPRALGLTKIAYGVAEVLQQLSIGRTSLYGAVKRGELTPVKLGRKTLFFAADLAAFLTKLKRVGPTAGLDRHQR